MTLCLPIERPMHDLPARPPSVAVPRPARDPSLAEAARWIPTVPTPTNGLEAFHSPLMMAADAEPHRLLTDRPIVLAGLEESNAVSVASNLQAGGYLRVERLSTAHEPGDAVQRLMPALVFIDLTRVAGPGLEVLSALRRREEFRSLPVVALVAPDDAPSRRLALEAGCSDVLATPVDPSELAMRVRNSLVLKVFEERVANVDPVTGLPNRRVFLDRLRTSLARLGGQSQHCALLHVALERFDPVAASLGHTAAEHVMSRVARRLRSCVRRDEEELRAGRVEAALICRLESDGFVILLPRVDSADAAARVARRILATLAPPLRIGLDDVVINPSVGIAVAPEDGDDVDTLVRCARAATERAKHAGRNTYRFHAGRLNEASIERLKLETQLRGARQRGELRLLYQPKVDRVSGRICGAEALLRWQAVGLPRMGPDHFLPLAEDSGLLVDFGEWVVQEACTQLARWRDSGLRGLRLSINLSARELASANIVEVIGSALARHGLGRGELTVEVGERLVTDSPKAYGAALEGLRRLGVGVAVGEFGLGDASLNDLRHLPMDEVKIDRAFIGGLPHAHADLALVRAIVVMAQSLGIRVVAEGVEHPEQLRAVQDLGIDEFQGFLLGHPMLADELGALARIYELNPPTLGAALAQEA